MEKSQKIILAVLGAILLVLLVVTIVVVVDRNKTVYGDFVPPPFDENAVKGRPDNVDKAFEYGELQLREGYVVLMARSPAVEDGAATLYLTAPESNKVWVRVELYDEKGNLLGGSGVLRPGEYVNAIELERVPKKTGLVVAKIISYEPDTYYSYGVAQAQIMLRVPEA